MWNVYLHGLNNGYWTNKTEFRAAMRDYINQVNKLITKDKAAHNNLCKLNQHQSN